MKIIDATKMLHHRNRAESFFDTMRFIEDDISVYGSAVTLLAVHSAISLADAVLSGYTGQRSKAENHRAASTPLKELCRKNKVPADGISHFEWLLERKTDFAYGDRAIALDDIKQAALKAERFHSWIYKTFPELAQ